MSKKVSIIILNWNGKKWLDNCIDSLINQTYKNIEIVFVDNNSSDDSVEYVKSKWPKVKVVLLDDNYGYAKGNNIGVDAASGEIVFILNNDTKLFPDCVEHLVNSFELNTLLIPTQLVGDFNSDLKDTELKILRGNGMDIFGYPYGVTNYLEQKIFYVDGAALFILKEDFKKLGGFDEELFMFQEDIDLSWKARLFGYKFKICENAKLYHFSGGSALGGMNKAKEKYKITPFRRYHNEKNIIRNIFKNYSYMTIAFVFPVLFCIHFIEFLLFLITNHLDLAKAYLNAYTWNIKNINDTFSKRHEIQSQRKISDKEIFRNCYFRYSKLTALIRLGLPQLK